MKIALIPACWLVAGAAAILPTVAVAQVPFSSTQSPGGNPFNRNSSLPPVTQPAQQQPQSNRPAGLMPYGGSTGMYPSTTVVSPVDANHKLGPRDLLSYRVAEDRDDKVYQLAVTDSGEIELPLGSLRVKATGKTVPELSSAIKSELEREYYKPGHATVFLGLISSAPNASKGKVYFTGEINSRGALDLPADGDLTVVQAILQLGGFTIDANLKGVFIFRDGAPKKGIQVNAKAVLNGESDKDVVLRPGDKIVVKKKIIGFDM